jgi:RNA polymerase sigma-70 factor (ECF subfamily)
LLEGRLQRGLRELPEDFRLAVVLCDVEGLSYEEIAAVTGWPLGTVRSRIHRGRRQLRRHLEAGSGPRTDGGTGAGGDARDEQGARPAPDAPGNGITDWDRRA